MLLTKIIVVDHTQEFINMLMNEDTKTAAKILMGMGMQKTELIINKMHYKLVPPIILEMDTEFLLQMLKNWGNNRIFALLTNLKASGKTGELKTKEIITKLYKIDPKAAATVEKLL